jgi:hypothetical protein
MSAAAVLTNPIGLSHTYASQLTELRNYAGDQIIDAQGDNTRVQSSTILQLQAPTVTLPGVSINATEASMTKLLVSGNVDVTANITAAALAAPAITAVTGVATPVISDATSITLQAPQVNIAGDLTMDSVTATIEATAPIVNATTKLVTPNVTVTDPATQDLVVDARQAQFSGKVVSATGVIAPSFSTADVLNDDMTVSAKNIILNGNVEIKGTLDTINTQILTVKDKEIVVGVIDADGDGLNDDPLDTVRDNGGLVVAGAPANLPSGTDATLYEHSLRWKLKDGDFDATEAAMAPHQKPMWTFSGGGIAIATPDLNAQAATWFMAPYFDAATQTASLGLYFKSEGFDPVLVQNFSTDIPNSGP